MQKAKRHVLLIVVTTSLEQPVQLYVFHASWPNGIPSLKHQLKVPNLNPNIFSLDSSHMHAWPIL